MSPLCFSERFPRRRVSKSRRSVSPVACCAVAFATEIREAVALGTGRGSLPISSMSSDHQKRPSGAKAHRFWRISCGTAEAVPFQNRFMRWVLHLLHWAPGLYRAGARAICKRNPLLCVIRLQGPAAPVYPARRQGGGRAPGGSGTLLYGHRKREWRSGNDDGEMGMAGAGGAAAPGWLQGLLGAAQHRRWGRWWRQHHGVQRQFLRSERRHRRNCRLLRQDRHAYLASRQPVYRSNYAHRHRRGAQQQLSLCQHSQRDLRIQCGFERPTHAGQFWKPNLLRPGRQHASGREQLLAGGGCVGLSAGFCDPHQHFHRRAHLHD